MGTDKRTRQWQAGGQATNSAAGATVSGQYSTPRSEMQPSLVTTRTSDNVAPRQGVTT